MPNLVESVKEMIKRGMQEQEIKQNLQELGVDDPDSVYSQAAKARKAAPAHEASLEANPSVSRLAAQAILPSVDLDSLERKIDDLEAQVKAVSEIMQKILDTDLQILLRLKPAGEEGGSNEVEGGKQPAASSHHSHYAKSGHTRGA